MKNSIHLALPVIAALCSHSVAEAQSCPTATNYTINSYENTYYPGLTPAVTAGSKTIDLDDATVNGFGSTPISQYDIVLIIQMQGAQINSSNNNNYGSGTGTGSGYLNNAQLMAGRMEYGVAANSVPITGGTLKLQSGLTYSYQNADYGTDGQYRYQVIRIPLYYNATLGNTLQPPAWNGYTGGVINLYVSNILNMNGQTIDASSAGFRAGGGVNYSNAGSTGSSSDYVALSTGGAGGSKGEGIAGTPIYLNAPGATSLIVGTLGEGYPNGSYDRGAPGNAGGGATDGQPSSNSNNAGGGGGGNGGAGGIGGNSWNSNKPVGGKPGAKFAQLSPSRLVMGGGGGAGSTDGGTGFPPNGFASSGAPGGGIVILFAKTITGSGTILANGAPPNTTLINDGSGGGGAGGSVLIYAGSGTSGLTVNASGSVGASNTGNGAKHGPGGGGGGGVIYSNNPLASATVAGGAAGFTTTLTTPTNYGAAAGSTGISSQSITLSQVPPFPVICNGLLAIRSLSASVTSNDGNNNIVWQAISDRNVQGFDVQKSFDSTGFSTIATITPQTSGNNEYHYADVSASRASRTLYYRIREKDADDSYSYSNIMAIKPSVSVFQPVITPNPASSSATLRFNNERSSPVSILMTDATGAAVFNKQFLASPGMNSVPLDRLQQLPSGLYLLQLNNGERLTTIKLFIRH